MKSRRSFRFLLSLFVIVSLINTNVTVVNAMNTGFATKDLSKQEQNTFLSNVNVSQLIQEPMKRSIKCFDVNKEGLVAVGQENGNNKQVCIYSSDGAFLYGYAFKCSGRFAVEWDGININVYFARSDVIVSLDSDGNVIAVEKVLNTIDNNTYRNDLIYSTNRIVGDATYRIQNDMGVFNVLAVSYSQLIVVNEIGEERIIYDVSTTQFLNTVTVVVLALLFTGLVVVIVVSQLIKFRPRI